MKIIAQGAEAKIFLIKKRIRHDPNLKEGLIRGNLVPFIVKDRISKKYRLPELDNKIRRRRTKAEAKLLTKASKIINTPKPLADPGSGRMIHMPYIDGLKLSDELNNFELKKQKEILKQIGEAVSKLHKADLIHGDLTTSNMILKKEEIIRHDPKLTGEVDKENFGSLYFIDFGLGFHSSKIEDKAVDIHVLKQALEAKHFRNWETLFNTFKKAYKNKQVLERLKKVEKRGRYKH